MSRERALELLLKRPRLVLGVVLVAVVVVAGVTLGHPRPTATGLNGVPATRVAGEGTLSGAVEGCGGPTGSCRVTSVGFCIPTCLTTTYVVVKTAGGGTVTRARLRRGRFSIAIPPGSYTLELLATGKAGSSQVFQSRRVTIRRDASSDVTFKLSIR